MRPDPTLLAFDTSGSHCAATVLVGGDLPVCRVETMLRGQAERLMPLLEATLREAGLRWPDLDAIAVGTGPGNFTGIRIAVATARGLALGIDRPAIGISGFAALAHGRPLPVTVRILAPRGLVYLQTFSPDGPTEPVLETGLADESASDPRSLVRNIALAAADRFAAGGPFGRPTPVYVRRPDASPPQTAAPVILP